VLRHRKITALLAGSLLGVSALALGTATASAGETADGIADAAVQAAQDPPGNNGTVKIDAVAFDDHPNNEPHVGCTFEVDFYGYDKGELFADVEFLAWPPTERAGDDQVLLSDSDIFIGEDDNSGGGSQAGLDAHREYTLDFSGITPHPQQGFHVRLNVHADGSQGADTKHKVFWVTGCGETESPPPPSTSTPPPTTSTPPTTTPGVGSTSPAGAPPSLPKTGAGFPVGSAALFAVLLMSTGGIVILASRGAIKLPHDGMLRLPHGVTIRLPYRRRH
jgi:hypothetical protein